MKSRARFPSLNGERVLSDKIKERKDRLPGRRIDRNSFRAYLAFVNAGVFHGYGAYHELPIGARVPDDESLVDGVRAGADR